MSVGCLFACLSLPLTAPPIPPLPLAETGAVIGVGFGLRSVWVWGIEPVAGAGAGGHVACRCRRHRLSHCQEDACCLSCQQCRPTACAPKQPLLSFCPFPWLAL